MSGVLEGFATIGLIIGLGALLAHLGILDLNSQKMLARIAFFVASPALMVTVLGETPVAGLFSSNLLASVSSVVVTATLFVVVARLSWKRNGSDTVIGTFSAVYVNAGNLGLPIAAYALGNASLIAPMLLTQLILLQPLGLAVLDATELAGTGGRRNLLRPLTQPLRNPLTLASLVGVALSVFDITLPRFVLDPLHLVGGMAVPAMLLAFGISLRLSERPGSGEPVGQIGFIVALKLVVQPAIAYLVATYVLHLDRPGVLAVTVVAALPTAQNVFTHAVRYDRGVILARDSIFVSTILSVPVLILIVALV